MRFLRTASTSRLLATLAGVVAAIAAGTAIAVAATSNSPVPRAKPLAQSLHAALTARPVNGVSADITFTNNLISSSSFTGDTKDPLLQGASGRLWWSKATGLRLELQTDNGDSQVVVNGRSFWVSDKTTQTVYEGTLPADQKTAKSKPAGSGVPTVAQIQTELNKLLGHARVSGTKTSNPGDIAGRPAYSVALAPKHDGGLLGSAQIAWDAVTGTPLKLAVYASGNSTPVLQLVADHISFGSVPSSYINISPPSGYKVVKIATAGLGAAGHAAHGKRGHTAVEGVRAVAGQVPFTLVAPRTLVGLPRQSVRLLDWGGTPAALITYGQNLGGMVIIEQKATAGANKGPAGGSMGGLALPTVTINNHYSGTELPTALGTILRYTANGVAYTVLGSVPSSAAEHAAGALTP